MEPSASPGISRGSKKHLSLPSPAVQAFRVPRCGGGDSPGDRTLRLGGSEREETTGKTQGSACLLSLLPAAGWTELSVVLRRVLLTRSLLLAWGLRPCSAVTPSLVSDGPGG